MILKIYPQHISENKKILFLLITVILGIIIISPLHNFQYFLAQGDHGRELYGFKKTMGGALPYRDFSWPFGPLLLHYYSLFFHFFGVSIQSVLLGQNFIILLIGILIYLICCTFMTPSLSSIAALYYWAYRDAEFFYSYHHIGGVLFILITIFCCLQYIKNAHKFYNYIGFLGLLLLLLTRLNMGMAIHLAFLSSLLFIDIVKKDSQVFKKWKINTSLSIVNFVIAALIYWFLLHPLPFYVIYQTFPYGNPQRGDAPINLLETLNKLWVFVFHSSTNSLPKIIFSLSIIFSMIYCSYSAIKNKTSRKLEFLLACGTLSIFLIFGMHEFLISGTWFRMLWAKPIFIILVFYLFHYLMIIGPQNIFTQKIKSLLLLPFFFVCFFQISDQHRYIKLFKNPQHLLHIGNNKIYTFQQPEWFKTVSRVVDYIQFHVPKNEKILAIPHDSLYYFLSERDSAIRQLDFFEHNFIPQEQEMATISELKRHKVNWVILSSRFNSQEPGMGFFSITHCKMLANYIDEHFKIEATFGDWQNPPGWAWNHGVRILKRIDSLVE